MTPTFGRLLYRSASYFWRIFEEPKILVANPPTLLLLTHLFISQSTDLGSLSQSDQLLNSRANQRIDKLQE